MRMVVAVALGILSAIIGGVGVSYLWGWFVAPLGMRDIGIAHATGLVLMVNLFKALTMDYSIKASNEAQKALLTLLMRCLIVAMVLLVGMVWAYFM